MVGDILALFGLGTLQVSGSASSLELLETGFSTVSSDSGMVFLFESGIGLF